MTASVIISTYNSPDWLDKVLIGYSVQSNKNFEIIIADDGSDERTRRIIARHRHHFISCKHIWHEDLGFRKCEILNKAIMASNTDYLIFSDGDCIPRKDFVQIHLDQRKKESYLSGGYFKLPMSISRIIDEKDISSQQCFSLEWLRTHKLKNSFKNNKLSNKRVWLSLLNSLTPTKPTWNGHNASGWKKDILSVNGFDERMKYGGEDREMGERLENLKIKPKQIRYKAICIHLDHDRGYVNDRDWKNNNRIREYTRKQKLTWTPFGINKDVKATDIKNIQ